ncbi:MAG: N-methyl-L-tryptophan oxidase [Planctomycetota bacterium]|nr:N-methyl-L-tryptophan oxidase [Planctomycetota bacterium]
MNAKEHFDCIVLGLGGMGSASLYHLAKRGLRVLGLERFGRAHSLGASHGRSRVIRQAYMEHSDYVPLVMRAYENWRALEERTGLELLKIVGGLMIGGPDSIPVAGSIRSAQEHGLPHEVLDAGQIRSRFPPLTPPDDFTALFEEKAGVLVPEQCVETHLRVATEEGATALFETKVLHWKQEGSGVRVETDKGDFSCDQLVISAGPWASNWIDASLVPLVVERYVMFWFEPVDGSVFAPEVFPIHIWEAEDGVLFYGFPSQAGVPGVKVAFHTVCTVCTPDEIKREVSEDEIEQMRSYLRRYVPSLAGRCLETRTCMYTSPPDKHFVIGRHPGCDNVVLLAGFSGHGFKFSSVIGEVAAELVCDGETRQKIGLFSPDRFLRA